MKEFWKKYRIYYKEFGIECFRRCHHGFLKLLKRELSQTPEFPSKKEREEGRGGGGGGRDRVGIRVRAERRRPFPPRLEPARSLAARFCAASRCRLKRWTRTGAPRLSQRHPLSAAGAASALWREAASPPPARWRALGTRYLRDSELTLFFLSCRSSGFPAPYGLKRP